jgi:hypothetical protein
MALLELSGGPRMGNYEASKLSKKFEQKKFFMKHKWKAQ